MMGCILTAFSILISIYRGIINNKKITKETKITIIIIMREKFTLPP